MAPKREKRKTARRSDLLHPAEESLLRLLMVGGFLLIASFILDPFVRELALASQYPALTFLMQWFTHGGTLFTVLFVVVSFMLYDEGRKRGILPLWVSFGTALVGSMILKIIVRRDRPGVVHLIPIIGTIDYSFPSSHTALAFCAIPLIRRAFPRVSWFFIGFAVLVAVSRIYVDAHFFSDVVGGALFGLGVGYLVLHVWGGDIKAKVSKEAKA